MKLIPTLFLPKSRGAVCLLCLLWMAEGGTEAATSLGLGTITVQPGTVAPLPVQLLSDTPVVAGEFEVQFASPYLEPRVAGTGSAARNHRVQSALPSPGLQRVVCYSVTNAPLGQGTIIQIPLQIPVNAPETTVSVVITNVLLVAPDGSDVQPVSLTAGTVTIRNVAPAAFTSIIRQSSGVVDLSLTGTPGESYVIQAAPAPDSGAWGNLSTNVATNGIVEFRDVSAAGQLQRFYRAVSEE